MSAGDGSRELDRDVAGAAGAHQRLLATLDSALASEQGLEPGAPSLLPGWTRGHVLTHIARNADSFVRVLDGRPQYEHGRAGRDADIEAGAARYAADLVDDVRTSIWRLEARWAADVEWDATAEVLRGSLSLSDVPFRRWRETEIHHIDLGLGYGFDDLPTEYVRLELRLLEMLWTARQPMGLTRLPEAALQLAPWTRLAWLMGRTEIDGLSAASVF